MTVGTTKAHGGGTATLQHSGPHSLANAIGKLIIIIMDNTNREQFIIPPLLLGYVSRGAYPGRILLYNGGGTNEGRAERRDRERHWVGGRGARGWERRGLMCFWWGLSRHGVLKHDHLTDGLCESPLLSLPHHSSLTVVTPERWSTNQHQLQSTCNTQLTYLTNNLNKQKPKTFTLNSKTTVSPGLRFLESCW